ncbi:MAG: GGDEF domain-containing protein [Acidobacteria bacterium]|nr:GGDEF domain-containing protein [Acidobacteriota bacterium]
MDLALPQETLLRIISVQQEIVEADLAVDQVMNVIVHAAARLTGADAAVIEIHEGDEMVYRAGAGTGGKYVGLRLKAATSISGLCVRLNQMLRCDDTEIDDRVDREACRRVGARSTIVMPLQYRGAALGVLKIYSGEPKAFDDRSAEILRLLVGIVSASMQRARDHEAVAHRALRDALTGLANRDQLGASMQERISAGTPFAVLFIDLDGFKQINDNSGHAAGDEVLRVVAGRITSSLRSRDIAARFGGDEFVILLDTVRSSVDADSAWCRIRDRIVVPIEVEAQVFIVGASGGIVMFPADGLAPEDLMRLADDRMYAEKQSRKNVVN